VSRRVDVALVLEGPAERRHGVRARRLGLEAPPAATRARPTVGHHDDVPEVARVAGRPVEELPVHHQARADARGDDHREVVLLVAGCAPPALAECEGLGVVVDERRQLEALGEAIAQRERTPLGDVERADGDAARRHRTAAPDADRDRLRVPGGDGLLDHGRQVVEQLCGVLADRRLDLEAVHLALVGDDRRGDLRATDVDRHHGTALQGLPYHARTVASPICSRT